MGILNSDRARRYDAGTHAAEGVGHEQQMRKELGVAVRIFFRKRVGDDLEKGQLPAPPLPIPPHITDSLLTVCDMSTRARSAVE